MKLRAIHALWVTLFLIASIGFYDSLREPSIALSAFGGVGFARTAVLFYELMTAVSEPDKEPEIYR